MTTTECTVAYLCKFNSEQKTEAVKCTTNYRGLCINVHVNNSKKNRSKIIRLKDYNNTPNKTVNTITIILHKRM